MRTLYNMSMAGMTLAAMADAIKKGEADLPSAKDYDTRAYLIEKLDEAFYSVQSDITAAVIAAAQLEGEGDNNDA